MILPRQRTHPERHRKGESRRGRTSPAVVAILVAYGAFVVNDPIAEKLQQMALFSLRHVAVVFGVIVCLTVGGRRGEFRYLSMAAAFGAAYAAMCITSLAATWDNQGPQNLYRVMGISGNIAWACIVGRAMTSLRAADWRCLFLGLFILGLIPLASGALEYFKGDYLITFGTMGEKGRGSFLFIRGLHTDKVDFATAISVPLLLSLWGTTDPTVHWRAKVLFLGVLATALWLLAFSFSTTGITGLGCGVLACVGSATRRPAQLLGVAVISVIIVGGGLYLMGSTDLGGVHAAQYRLKFARQVEQAAESNFRLLAARTCFERFLERPITGMGFGQHVSAIEQAMPFGGGNAHSVASVFADVGIAGGVAVIGYLYVCLAAGLAARPRARGEEMWRRCCCGTAFGLTFVAGARVVLYFQWLDHPVFSIWPALAFAAAGVMRTDPKDCRRRQ